MTFVVKGPQRSNRHYSRIEDAVNELSDWIVRASQAGFISDIPLWHVDIIEEEKREFTEAEMAPKGSNKVWEELKVIKEDIRSLKYDIATLRRGKL